MWRVALDRGPAVVKQVVGGADAEQRYAREVAALRLAAAGAARAGAAVVPEVWGTDPERRVIVLEYLAHQPPAGDWIVDYARALARLHASAGPQVVDVLPRWQGPTEADARAFLALAEELGAGVTPGVADELAALVHRLDAAPGRALLHGDPCPGNDLHTADGVKFIDLEGAAWGSGLVELAYLRIGFPTCWCVTAADPALLHRAERTYAATWRAETGAELPIDLTDACAGWLIRGDALVERALRGTADQLARLPYEDWSWGTGTARQRLAHRLAAVAEMTRPGAGRARDEHAGDRQSRDALRGLGALCDGLRQRMLARWPTLAPMPAQRP